MRFRTILGVATLFMTCFTLAVWSQPLATQPGGSRTAAENRSISGKISGIGDASFSVDVLKQNHQPQTMWFLVDDSTKVDGKLTVGAHAVVEYRADGGNYVAVHVVVKPSSGVSPS